MKKLKFSNYKVNKLAFEEKGEYSNNIKVTINSDVDKNDEDNAVVSLLCKVESDDGLFNLAISISGDFTVEDDENDSNIDGVTNDILFQRNSISILFPYLRAAISQVTSMGSGDPIVLPPMNVLEFISQKEKEETEN